MIHCFTSISLNYLPKARVLASTLKSFHPNWHFILCISDKEPSEFSLPSLDGDIDEIIWFDELFDNNHLSWCFKHNVVECCTAVKGLVLRKLLDNGAEKVFYLDPDIAIFNELTPLVEYLDEYDILLTPHQLQPEDNVHGIKDNELCSLQHGIYNLGFLGISNGDEGISFSSWWESRLIDYCYDDKSAGLFTDQRWCDFIPAYFSNFKIIRDPGYNVASWNLSNRKIEINRAGEILVNDYPLRFLHFTKLGKTGEIMTQKYARDNINVYELWFWYRNMVKMYYDDRIKDSWWYYGQYSDGTQIKDNHRKIYRNREDLQEYFPDPFKSNGPESFHGWLLANNLA